MADQLADEYWDEIAPVLRKSMGYSIPTPEEAEAELNAAAMEHDKELCKLLRSWQSECNFRKLHEQQFSHYEGSFFPAMDHPNKKADVQSRDEIELAFLGTLEPKWDLGLPAILFEYDGEPLTYIATTPAGLPLLLHQINSFGMTSLYLVVTTSKESIYKLLTGDMDLFSALCRPSCWIARFCRDELQSCDSFAFNAVPSDWLPKAGVTLCRKKT